MRIAVIADLHANLPALEATIRDIGAQGVDKVVVAGDLVGRGPHGTAVVETVRDLGWPCVRGNHEGYLLAFVHRRVPEDWWRTEEWAASRWMQAELTDDVVEFLDTLPTWLNVGGPGGLHIVHGSPVSNREGLGPWTSDDVLHEHLAPLTEPVLVRAHTHRPMRREIGDSIVVNVGSVGLPFNGDWRAQYSIFQAQGSGWDVELRQVEWDRPALLRAYKETGFLVNGGITAALLAREVKQARPFLVPFLRWCTARDVVPTTESAGGFLESYDCTQPLSRLFQNMQS